MLKLTLPDEDDFYADLVAHPKVLRVVALSGGYSREEANARLARQHGVVASFSRALTEGLSVQQTEEEFNAAPRRLDPKHLRGVDHLADDRPRRVLESPRSGLRSGRDNSTLRPTDGGRVESGFRSCRSGGTPIGLLVSLQQGEPLLEQVLELSDGTTLQEHVPVGPHVLGGLGLGRWHRPAVPVRRRTPTQREPLPRRRRAC